MISVEMQKTQGEFSLNITLEIGLAVSYKTKHKLLMPYQFLHIGLWEWKHMLMKRHTRDIAV